MGGGGRGKGLRGEGRDRGSIWGGKGERGGRGVCEGESCFFVLWGR